MGMLLSGAVVLGFLVSAGAAEPVKREAVTGSRLPRISDSEERESKKLREVQARYGECVIKKHYAIAREFVLTADTDQSTYRKFAQKVADGPCLVSAASAAGGVEMRFPGDTMRYTLAEALFRRDFSEFAPQSVADVAPLARLRIDEAEYAPKPGMKRAKIEELAEILRKWQAVAYMAFLGECVVRADPNQSYALLKTQHSSTEEGVLLNALSPALSQCITAGQQLTLNKASVRGTIALNYYRLAQAPRQTVAPAGASK